VLEAYLAALEAGNCDTAGQLVGAYAPHTWTDLLCGGETRVTGFRILGDPYVILANEVGIDTVISTTGGAHGVPIGGEIYFDFSVQQETGGAWRIVDWWAGPRVNPSRLPYSTPTGDSATATP
jgi:hypothetical protein